MPCTARTSPPGPASRAAPQLSAAASAPHRSRAGPPPDHSRGPGSARWSWTDPERQARTGGIPDTPRSAAHGRRSAARRRNAMRRANRLWPAHLVPDADAGTTAPPGMRYGQMRAAGRLRTCRRGRAGTPACHGLGTGRLRCRDGAADRRGRAAAVTAQRPGQLMRSRRPAIIWPATPQRGHEGPARYRVVIHNAARQHGAGLGYNQ